MPEIYAVLPPPPSSNRYWRNYNGRMVISAEAKAYKQEVKYLMFGAMPFVGDVIVTLRWYRERKSGDLDNRLKVIFDALQGVAYNDDNQIVEIHCFRYDDKDDPRLEIHVEAAE